MVMQEVSPGHMGYASGVSVWQSGPNSAGGVSVKFRYRNDSEKNIKYVTFSVIPYNAVKDVQKCETSGISEARLQVTGPINAKDAGSCTFENVWYNSTISTVELTKTEIEYMDGSKEILKGGEIQYEEITEADLEELQEMLEESLKESQEMLEKSLEVKKALEEIQKPAGCYIATAVYGSYDCPQVWTLRRFRDGRLARSLPGRAFIRAYYAVSPTLVRWFGGSRWFRRLWRGPLDRLVARLQREGVEDTPYNDKAW